MHQGHGGTLAHEKEMHLAAVPHPAGEAEEIGHVLGRAHDAAEEQDHLAFKAQTRAPSPLRRERRGRFSRSPIAENLDTVPAAPWPAPEVGEIARRLHP